MLISGLSDGVSCLPPRQALGLESLRNLLEDCPLVVCRGIHRPLLLPADVVVVCHHYDYVTHVILVREIRGQQA